MKKRYWLVAVGIILFCCLLWLNLGRASRTSIGSGKNSTNSADRASYPLSTPSETQTALTPEHSPLKTKAEKAKREQELAAETRSAMKISLAASYGGEKSFFSEYGRYTTDYLAMGYSPEAAPINFKAGFLRAFIPPADGSTPQELNAHQTLTLDAFNQNLDENSRTGPEWSKKHLQFTDKAKEIRLEEVAQYCEHSCTAGKDFFEIITAANLDDDPDLDVWLMNQNKEMKHVHDDLAPENQ